MKINLDIHTGVTTAFIAIIIIIVFCLWRGVAAIRKARNLKFFRMRRERIVAGWRLIFFALILGLIAFVLNRFAEPAIYNFFPPTVTLTLTSTTTHTATVTQTPTISLTPTITLTPSETDTPTVTSTPHVPLAIEMRFESSVTPNVEAIFSPLVFAQGLDKNFQPINPATTFQNPVGHLYAQFTYDRMIIGSQWTALWYRGSELVNYESKPWDGGTGGIGYTDWNPQPHEWLPGEYEVQIFVGLTWIFSGRFIVEGEAPTPLPSYTATSTATGTPTSTATDTPLPTPTPTPSVTASPTYGPSPTPTKSLTPTPSLTRTPLPPTRTPRPSDTRQPTETVTATRPTGTRFPTETATPTRPTATRAPTYTWVP